jgi:hypothetical protein
MKHKYDSVCCFFQVKLSLLAEYGQVQSFYAEKYPECVQGYRGPKEGEAE